MRRYIRTCQSCDYELVLSHKPKDTTSKAFRFRKCPKCKSEDFDFGSYRGYDTKSWREKWKALTGRELDMPEDEMETLLDEDGDEGLFEGNALYNRLISLNY
jgi:hypothetical protein